MLGNLNIPGIIGNFLRIIVTLAKFWMNVICFVACAF